MLVIVGMTTNLPARACIDGGIESGRALAGKAVQRGRR